MTVKAFTRLVLAAFGVAAVTGLATLAAQQSTTLTPSEMAWPSRSRAGESTLRFVLDGDPNKPGLYTFRLKFAPNTKTAPHFHRDARAVVVVSGTYFVGSGSEFDESKLKALPAGSFYTEPADVPHFGTTRSEEAVIQITGYGPSSTTYVNPADDPNRK